MGEEQSLVDEEFALLRTCLSTIPDPLQRWRRVHSLEGVLSLSVLGLIANCRSLSVIRRFGELHPEALQGLKCGAALPCPLWQWRAAKCRRDGG